MKMSVLVRSVLALTGVVAISACAGSSPASPTSTSAAAHSTVVGGASGSGSATVAAAGGGGSLTGTAYFNPFATGGFPDAVENGVTGRDVALHGAIEGINFEPGTCAPGADPNFFGLHCVLFGSGPGQFTRLRPGGVAFTTCHCTVGGVGGPNDTVTLKISYPPATPPQYPGGFTKFTFQDGTGELAGLSGQGTLDLSSGTVEFTYRFSGK
jgi:hypothetical protein